MKKCYKCNIEKQLIDFYKNQNRCKDCEKEYYRKNKSLIAERSKRYRELTKENKKEYDKEYRKLNKEKIILAKKEYYEKNRDEIRKRGRYYYEINRDLYAKRKKEYSANNKQKISESGSRYYQLNKERIIQNVSAYRVNNKDKLNTKKKQYVRKRLKEDSVFKLGYITRGLICKSFKRGKRVFSKKTKTSQILGCSISEFKNYLESKFSEGMTFDNHGEWHLDHIVPIATAKTEDDIIKLNHYTNFQPMWAKDNLKKGKKIIGTNIN